MAAICRSRSKKRMAPAGLQRAWSTVPVLQREGPPALTAGEYRSGNSQQETPDFSGHGHAWPAGRLDARRPTGRPLSRFNLGVGKNMGYFGALSLDITQANATWLTTANIRGSRCVFSITIHG